VSAPSDHKAVTVVSVGMLPRLLSLREAILTADGYEVFSTSRPAEAIVRIKEGRCGVLLLCHSIPREWCERLVQTFHECCPEGRVISFSKHPTAAPATNVDAIVYNLDGPEALLNAIERKAA
jgi:DNA-binding NtrC family response regulator